MSTDRPITDAVRDEAAQRWFAKDFARLGRAEQRVVQTLASRSAVSHDVDADYRNGLSLGERLADRVALFGGSWTFIGLFATALLTWAVVNSFVLHRPFDPYPYIFLNLLLSMLAAVQAPVIMMSQNRQAVKDRHNAAHDYEVNLKAELEIMALHEKLDALRTNQLERLIAYQERELQFLIQLVQQSVSTGTSPASPPG